MRSEVWRGEHGPVANEEALQQVQEIVAQLAQSLALRDRVVCAFLQLLVDKKNVPQTAYELSASAKGLDLFSFLRERGEGDHLQGVKSMIGAINRMLELYGLYLGKADESKFVLRHKVPRT